MREPRATVTEVETTDVVDTTEVVVLSLAAWWMSAPVRRARIRR
jgi:hypothetical protein